MAIRAHFLFLTPHFAPEDLFRIEGWQHLHDPAMAGVVPPGFPLVFPVPGFRDEEVVSETQALLAGETDFAIEMFACHVHVEAETGEVLELLRPERGAGQITALHKKLYSGAFRPYLPAGMPYMPAITIGRGDEFETANSRMEALNETGLRIPGRANKVEVYAFGEGPVDRLAEIPLG